MGVSVGVRRNEGRNGGWVLGGGERTSWRSAGKDFAKGVSVDIAEVNIWAVRRMVSLIISGRDVVAVMGSRGTEMSFL